MYTTTFVNNKELYVLFFRIPRTAWEYSPEINSRPPCPVPFSSGYVPFFFFPSRSFIPLLFVSHDVFANAASAVIKCGPGAYLNNSSPSFIIADAEVHFLAIICQHNITITVVAVYPCRNLLFISYIFDEKGYNTLIYKLYCLIIWNKKI